MEQYYIVFIITIINNINYDLDLLVIKIDLDFCN